MEGTLSLFDWQPQAQVADAPPPEATVARALSILVFDCETTGIDHAKDQVIELCVQHGLADDAPKQVWRLKPTTPIHPAAQAVHGIAMAELEGCPMFADVADEIVALFADVDVVIGYNVAFDIDMLQAEYARIGRPMLDFGGKRIVDAFRLWQQFEPRSLQHAHKRFVGDGFAAAHSASADVSATGRVLVGMLRHFNLHEQGWDHIASVADPNPSRSSWVGPSRHLKWEGDVIIVNFGKHADAALHALASGPDRSFLRWVIERDFPVHVAEVCKAALELSGDELHAWARRRFGHTAQTGPAATVSSMAR